MLICIIYIRDDGKKATTEFLLHLLIHFCCRGGTLYVGKKGLLHVLIIAE